MARLTSLRTSLGWLGHARGALGLIRQAAPGWSLVWAALLLVQGLIPAALVALTKWVVDAVAAAVGAGATWEAAGVVILPAALMGALMLLQRVLGGVTEWVGTAQAELVDDHIKGLIHEKTAGADFAFFESSQYYDLLEQVNSQASGRTLQLLGNAGSLGQSTVTFVSIAALLTVYAWWIPLALLVSALPAFQIVLRHNRKYHAWWSASTPRRRLAGYYDHMLTQDMAAAEVRINRLGVPFRTRYREARRSLREERLRLLRNQVVARLGAALLALVVTAAVMAWVVLRALRGQATLGDLALFYSAFTQGQALMGGLLQNAGAVYTNTLFLEHLFRFLALDNALKEVPAVASYPEHLREGVRFENVTFRYPGSEAKALDGFSLEIPAGKIVAIVGENGAGKSTFIKLLCRFYDPTSGRVTVDGTDLREFAHDDIRRRVAVLFQFPMKYQMSAAENIRIGERLGTEGVAEDARMAEAAHGAGADAFLGRLPRTYETLLGRWFEGGTELSGGEWQRVALARAFYRRSPLVILDEPTSFMDSWAENDWLARFKEMVRGRTALVITHRFSTAMQADVIHVMDQGRIVESGTHASLIARGGLYAASWSAQMRQAEEAGRQPAGDGAADPLAPVP